MESVAGGFDAAGEGARGESADAGWIAPSPCRRRRPGRHCDIPPGKPGVPVPLAVTVPGPAALSSALSTESIQDMAAGSLWVACGAMGFFCMGMLAMDEAKGPQPYQAIAVAGEIPETTVAELGLYKERLKVAMATIADMDQAVGLAAVQLNGCVEVGR